MRKKNQYPRGAEKITGKIIKISRSSIVIEEVIIFSRIILSAKQVMKHLNSMKYDPLRDRVYMSTTMQQYFRDKLYSELRQLTKAKNHKSF